MHNTHAYHTHMSYIRLCVTGHIQLGGVLRVYQISAPNARPLDLAGGLSGVQWVCWIMTTAIIITTDCYTSNKTYYYMCYHY